MRCLNKSSDILTACYRLKERVPKARGLWNSLDYENYRLEEQLCIIEQY